MIYCISISTSSLYLYPHLYLYLYVSIIIYLSIYLSIYIYVYIYYIYTVLYTCISLTPLSIHPSICPYIYITLLFQLYANLPQALHSNSWPCCLESALIGTPCRRCSWDVGGNGYLDPFPNLAARDGMWHMWCLTMASKNHRVEQPI